MSVKKIQKPEVITEEAKIESKNEAAPKKIAIDVSLNAAEFEVLIQSLASANTKLDIKDTAQRNFSYIAVHLMEKLINHSQELK